MQYAVAHNLDFSEQNDCAWLNLAPCLIPCAILFVKTDTGLSFFKFFLISS